MISSMNRLSRICLMLTPAIAFSSLLVAQQPAPGGPPRPPAPAAAQAGRGGRGPAPVKSPEVATDGRVTFRLRAPNAKEVAVSMSGKPLPMQKDDQGVWSATTDVSPNLQRSRSPIGSHDTANRPSSAGHGNFEKRASGCSRAIATAPDA